MHFITCVGFQTIFSTTPADQNSIKNQKPDLLTNQYLLSEKKKKNNDWSKFKVQRGKKGASKVIAGCDLIVSV